MPHLICTVTNDLSYDQRMQRICTTLANAGYQVTLVGRLLPHSIPLEPMVFQQHRLRCRFSGGFLFYAEFNLRLWAYLMRASYDAACSVDLDSLPAGCLATLLRRKKRLFDAHEYFTEVPEVTDRPLVKLFWSAIARLCLPFYRHAYTVGPALAAIFEKKYSLKFGVVRNITANTPVPDAPPLPQKPVLLYQGALNEGRGIECLLEAMQQLEGLELWLAGEGDRSTQLRQFAQELHVQDKVVFLGKLTPAALKTLTPQAWLGLNVLENKGLSYYYSLANKFFDYTHAQVPVLTMDFPEYRALNEEYEVAVLLDQLSTEQVVQAIRYLQEHPGAYQQLKAATQKARLAWTWEKEAEALLRYWRAVFQ